MAPYLQLLFGGINLAAIYAVFKSIVYNLHMFQLNGYRFDTHMHWMAKNTKRYLIEAIVFVLSFTGLIKNDILMGFSAAALFIGVFALIPENRQRPQKKALVYTPRVKRLTVTTLVLIAAAYAGAIVCLAGPNKHLAFMIMGLICALVPFIIILANLINKPMELGINRHYLNDAKRMLKDCPDLDTIGITGSYGKTSVKFYLYTILRAWTDTLVTPESYNTPMGIVKTIRGSLKSSHKIFLCEMGAKWVGDIKELCDIVHPHHGIITSLGEQHLESFGSKENIIKTKYELADALPSDGRLYVNWDNEVIRANPPKRPFIKYGTTEGCDFRATNIRVSSTGSTFTVETPDGSAEFDTKLLGGHNVLNITGAIAAAHGFGMKLEDMKIYVRRIEAVPHRMQLVNKGNVTIIDDAFNSNPAGCRAALTTLKNIDGLRVLVTPGMVELGGREDELNAEFGAYAAECCDHIVLIGEKQTAAIKKGVLSAGFPENKLHVYEQFTEGMKFVYGIPTEKKKIVLLENDLPDNY